MKPPIRWLARWQVRSAAIALLLAAACTQDDEVTPLEPASTPSMAVTATSAYDIVKVSSVTIDGNLTEWSNIPAISLADNSGRTGGVDNTAKVKLAWNDTYLYASYNVTDTEVLAVQTARDHPEIYKDDEVELYIDPQGDGAAATSMTTTDFQFLANVRDALGDNRGTGTASKDESYNPGSFLAKAVTNGTVNGSGTDVGYTVELRISWADLGVSPAAGHFMRIDPAVGDRDGTGAPPVQSFDWSGTTSSWNNPSIWKDVQLVNPPPPESAYDIVKVGGSAITIDGNTADWTGVASFSMADDPARGAAANTAKVKLAWTDTHLYALYDVTDSELLAVQTARDHGEIYKDDEVELYLDPQGDGASATSMSSTDYQLLANIRDAVADNRGTGTPSKDASFNAASFTAKTASNGTVNGGGADTGYAIELRISWADLGITPGAGHFMRLDAAVGDRDGSGPPPVESFDWAAAPGTYNNPSIWKYVRLVVDATAPAAPSNLVLNAVSSSQIDVSWTASSSADAAKYNIYRGTTSTPTLVTTVTGSPYRDTELTAGTSYTYQISAVDAAGNASPKTAPASATTQSTSAPGRPFGPFGLFSAADPVGAESFTLSHDFTSWSNQGGSRPHILDLIADARARGVKLVTAMTGGGHDQYITNGTFDMQKWKLGNPNVPGSGMNGYRNSVIQDAVAQAVADGVILGNVIMDEPEHDSWGKTASGEDFMTKAMLDEMARYVKAIFPTLPVGVDFGPTRAHWRPAERFSDVDFVNHQYNWWVTQGNVVQFRDSALVWDGRDGVRTLLGINVLNGGIQAARDGQWNCPLTTTGGRGTSDPNCRVTAAQLRDWGILFGRAGAGVKLWKYDRAMMGQSAYQQAAQDVAAELSRLPTQSWRRP